MSDSEYLAKDATRELYDLGKTIGSIEWRVILSAPGQTGRDYDPFVVDPDHARVARDLISESWPWPQDDCNRAGYLRDVARDIVRWAGSDVVRLTHGGSHDGWPNLDGNPDGSRDDGRITGSRYTSDHEGDSLDGALIQREVMNP